MFKRFVGKKEKHRDRNDAADADRGDCWDHVVLDPVSRLSDAVNTVFVERHNGSDRQRNSRKVRKTYRFSNDWEVHEAVTYFTMYQANFGCPVRTLRQKDEARGWQQRTPAMAAGLTDRVWSISEWLSIPSVQR